MQTYIPPLIDQPARLNGSLFDSKVIERCSIHRVLEAVPQLREAAQQHTEDAILTMAEIMNNRENPPQVRLMAADMLLDRGHGKAREHVMIEQQDTMTVAYRTSRRSRRR